VVLPQPPFELASVTIGKIALHRFPGFLIVRFIGSRVARELTEGHLQGVCAPVER